MLKEFDIIKTKLIINLVVCFLSLLVILYNLSIQTHWSSKVSSSIILLLIFLAIYLTIKKMRNMKD